MFLKNSPIKRGILIFVVLIVAAFFSLRPAIEWYTSPPKQFNAARSPVAPDYTDIAFWSAHPDIRDSSDLAPDGVATIDPELAKVDVFFVQPTTHFTGGSWNSDMSTASFAEQGTEHIIGTMASVFSSCCRVYAPRYRQAHLAAFIRTGSDAAIAALDLAYTDVEQAFQAFLSARDPNRPFIIASHSQGTLHALRLMSKFVDGQPLQRNLVAAYLIGYWVPEDALTKIIPDTPLCENATATGCLITYDTYDVEGTGRDPDGVLPIWYPTGWEWANRPKTLCVNPLTWEVDGGKADAQQNLGAIPMKWQDDIPKFVRNQNPGFVYQTLGAPLVGYTSARCHAEGSLMVDPQKGTQFDNRGAGEDRSLHPNDWNLFHMNLRRNAEQRINAYLAQ